MQQGNTYQKLEAIFANISVRHLSEVEAQRKLHLVMRAALSIQMRARKWIVQARAKIEQEHKITCRSEYAFSSNEPPDPAADDARRHRRDHAGWRAPLTKRYLPLGEVALKLERKPDWGQREELDADVGTGQEQAHTFMGHGESVRGVVPKFGCAYFQTYMYDAKAQLTVTVEALTGDPDLFMSRNNQYPDQIHHTWSSVGVGADAIEVFLHPTHPPSLSHTRTHTHEGGAGRARRQEGPCVHRHARSRQR